MTQTFKIPIRIKGRSTVIGFCDTPPCGTGLTLAVMPRLLDRLIEDEGDQLTRDVISARITYDFNERCYWADDYACLRSGKVEPY